MDDLHVYFLLPGSSDHWAVASLSTEHNKFMCYGGVVVSSWLCKLVAMAYCKHHKIEIFPSFAAAIIDNDNETEDTCFSGKVFNYIGIAQLAEADAQCMPVCKLPLYEKNYFEKLVVKSGYGAYMSFIELNTDQLKSEQKHCYRQLFGFLAKVNEDYRDMKEHAQEEIGNRVFMPCFQKSQSLTTLEFIQSCWHLNQIYSSDDLNGMYTWVHPDKDVVRYLLAHVIRFVSSSIDFLAQKASFKLPELQADAGYVLKSVSLLRSWLGYAPENPTEYSAGSTSQLGPSDR